ncbi:MAG: HD domain-containing phosphohydrolase [Aquabacterium sp.]
MDLLISDMRMPGMSGAALMQQVRTQWPGITRLMLSGHADVAATISAINEGQVHRYLTKPWSDAELLLTLKEALHQRFLEQERARLEAMTHAQNEELKHLNAHLEDLVAERTEALEAAHERLKKNYFQSIKTFSNLLELRGGRLLGHARRVADMSFKVARAMKLDEAACNDVLIAALMHDIGHIGQGDELIAKPITLLSPAETHQYRQHTLFGEQALMWLDDMQAVAAIVRGHHERHDGQGYPDGLAGEAIPVGARILAVADAYDDLRNGHLVSRHLSLAEARAILERGRGTQFDPDVLGIFFHLLPPETAADPPQAVLLRPDELQPGMVMARDFLSSQGMLLLAAEHVLSPDLIDRIKLYEKRGGRPVLLATRPGISPVSAKEPT